MGHEGHEHEHEHEHAHAHSPHGQGEDELNPSGRHTAGSRDPDGRREGLAPGAGAGKVLFLDAPSGLAGDMIVASLVDLGVPRETIADSLAALPVSGFHVHFGTRVRSGVVACSFEVHVDAPQPSRTYATVRSMVEHAALPDGTKARALRTFHRLAVAEAKVHRTHIDDVHFHEVGAVDAIADVVGSAAALSYLGAELVVSPLPMGRGFVRAAHGTLPLPAPATVECLVGLATYDAELDFELVTPTGAAIVGAHATASQRWPSMAPERIGWGAGSAELPDRPNLLRAVLGAPVSSSTAHSSAEHVVLEANVDDATGELAGSWIETLMSLGALDTWATPIVMKKGRPALTISALVPLDRADVIAHAMLRETTSLGVRRYDVRRSERPRRVLLVATPFGALPVKIAEGPFGPAQAKPEFDACVAAAQAYGVPVREVLRVVMSSLDRDGRGQS
ncbi:MAG: nickel pincer cofactor biosynthesis protein LarC [Myxococcota bacterium]|nr:nickel pincer cofactor biosynthesis protein LarC [Myxococcota bacterium]